MFLYILLAIIVLVGLVVIAPLESVVAAAILKITSPAKNGLAGAAGKSLIVKGTSMAPNATDPRCEVKMQTNQAGYLPVTPLGNSSGPFTNWTATSAPLLKGLNSIEAQLQCFKSSNPSSVLFAKGVEAAKAGPPIFTKHFVRNVTAP